MRALYCALIALCLTAASAHADDWRVGAKEHGNKSIALAEQEKIDSCGRQADKAVRDACEAGFNVAIADSQALSAKLDYMMSVDAIGDRNAELKKHLQAVVNNANFKSDVDAAVARSRAIETIFNTYRSSAVDKGK